MQAKRFSLVDLGDCFDDDTDDDQEVTESMFSAMEEVDASKREEKRAQ